MLILTDLADATVAPTQWKTLSPDPNPAAWPQGRNGERTRLLPSTIFTGSNLNLKPLFLHLAWNPVPCRPFHNHARWVHLAVRRLERTLVLQRRVDFPTVPADQQAAGSGGLEPGAGSLGSIGQERPRRRDVRSQPLHVRRVLARRDVQAVHCVQVSRLVLFREGRLPSLPSRVY